MVYSSWWQETYISMLLGTGSIISILCLRCIENSGLAKNCPRNVTWFRLLSQPTQASWHLNMSHRLLFHPSQSLDKAWVTFIARTQERKSPGWLALQNLTSLLLYLRYSCKWSLSVLVTTRAMSLQKPRWQALMLSLRRSSWVFPPETRSMSLITQITEHLSMVCRTRPQQGSECDRHLSYRDWFKDEGLSLWAFHLWIHRISISWPTRTPGFLQNDWQSSTYNSAIQAQTHQSCESPQLPSRRGFFKNYLWLPKKKLDNL